MEEFELDSILGNVVLVELFYISISSIKVKLTIGKECKEFNLNPFSTKNRLQLNKWLLCVFGEKEVYEIESKISYLVEDN